MKVVNLLKFIDTVSNHPVIHDMSSTGYKADDRKNNVWRVIKCTAMLQWSVFDMCREMMILALSCSLSLLCNHLGSNVLYLAWTNDTWTAKW